MGICGYDLKSGYFVEEGYSVRALVKRPVEPIGPTGPSWMFNLKKSLPDSIQTRLNDIPSAGRFSFNGALKEVTNENCVEKARRNQYRLLSPAVNLLRKMLRVLRRLGIRSSG